MPSTNCNVTSTVVVFFLSDRSGELQHPWKEGTAEAAAATAACPVTVGRVTDAAKGRAGGAEQPAVQGHDEPERVIRRAPEPAARRRQRQHRRRQPRAAAAPVVRGLLRRVLEMTCRARVPDGGEEEDELGAEQDLAEEGEVGLLAERGGRQRRLTLLATGKGTRGEERGKEDVTDKLTPRDRRGKGEMEKSSCWSTSPL